jgi:uncharacterized membrane protein AbrB (regulator of aidB expression)
LQTLKQEWSRDCNDEALNLQFVILVSVHQNVRIILLQTLIQLLSKSILENGFNVRPSSFSSGSSTDALQKALNLTASQSREILLKAEESNNDS